MWKVLKLMGLGKLVNRMLQASSGVLVGMLFWDLGKAYVTGQDYLKQLFWFVTVVGFQLWYYLDAPKASKDLAEYLEELEAEAATEE